MTRSARSWHNTCQGWSGGQLGGGVGFLATSGGGAATSIVSAATGETVVGVAAGIAAMAGVAVLMKRKVSPTRAAGSDDPSHVPASVGPAQREHLRRCEPTTQAPATSSSLPSPTTEPAGIPPPPPTGPSRQATTATPAPGTEATAVPAPAHISRVWVTIGGSDQTRLALLTVDVAPAQATVLRVAATNADGLTVSSSAIDCSSSLPGHKDVRIDCTIRPGSAEEFTASIQIQFADPDRDITGRISLVGTRAAVRFAARS